MSNILLYLEASCILNAFFFSSGKKGIGGIKRPPSPSVLERVSKIAKQTEEMSAGNFRDRTRQEYEERQTEGRLRHSQSTCHTLDTKEGIEVFNIIIY